jgi:hypothetical protein
MPIGNGSPALTGRRSRTSHLVSLPIDGELAVIKTRGRLGLPTHIWRHRTYDVDVIARLTVGKHLRIDIAHIHQMLIGKQLMLRSLLMKLSHDLSVWRGGGSGGDLDNEMGLIGLTGLG